jgi:regulator of sigma E protease
MNMFLLSIASFLLAIGLLVAVHEWGHYIVARMAGVKVLRFSVGFGRPVWLRRGGPDQTEYCLSALPLGGYVKLLDEREGEVAPSERHRAFNRVPIAARIAILLAGPIMNILFAIIAYWMMYAIGVPGMQPIVGKVEPDSVAARAGLRSDDRILEVGDSAVATWEGAIIAIIDELLEEERIRLVLRSADNTEKTVYLDVKGQVRELTEPGKLFSGLGMEPWSPVVAPVIGEIISGGTAEGAALREGDKILAVGADKIPTWDAWVAYVQGHPGETLDLLVERNGTQMHVNLPVLAFEQTDGTVVGRIGAGPHVAADLYDKYIDQQRYGFMEALPVAIKKTWSMSALTVKMMSRIVTGDVSVKNISGPVNIAEYAGYSASLGLASFLSFLAVVSLSLGVLNLLPIPVLDGGQVLYQVAEFFKGGPLSVRAQLIGQQIGVVFLVLLMGFAFYNDLSRVFS